MLLRLIEFLALAIGKSNLLPLEFTLLGTLPRPEKFVLRPPYESKQFLLLSIEILI